MALVQPQLEELDGSAGIERTLLSAEALYKICGMVSFHEFLRLRLVCTEWESVVLSHPRIQRIQVRLGKTYRKEGEHIDQEQGRGARLTWTAVHFQSFSFNATQRFNRNWDRYSNNITKLEVERITVACNDLLEFLKRCPAVEDLKFHNIRFETCQRENTRVFGGLVGPRQGTVTAHCVHSGWIPDPNEVLIPPRIRSLHLVKFDFFPLCILDYVASRCRGTLEHLKYCDAKFSQDRFLHLPSMEDIQNRIFTIFIQSSGTLQTFKMSEIIHGDQLLQRIINADTAPQSGGPMAADQLRLRLREIDVEQCLTDTRPFGLAYPGFINQFNCPLVEKVRIRVSHRLDVSTLNAPIERLTALTQLQIDVNNGGPAGTLDIATLLQLLPNLAELEIKDRCLNRSLILQGYALNLPASITKLDFGHKHRPRDTYRAVCNSTHLAALTKLVVSFGKRFSDDMLQAVIANFPNLREFECRNSQELTDSGVTGLSIATCNTLLSTNSYRLMLTQTARPTNRSISELKYLNRLSFDGCRKISDVSLLVAIRFPHLRFLNMSLCYVTDVGLANIHEHNPGIECLSIRKCRVSHFGINELVKNCPTIINVTTSMSVLKRKLGNIKYEQHPNFSKVVKLTGYDQTQD